MTKNQFSVSENPVFFGYFLITDNARFSAVNRLCVSAPADLYAPRDTDISRQYPLPPKRLSVRIRTLRKNRAPNARGPISRLSRKAGF